MYTHTIPLRRREYTYQIGISAAALMNHKPIQGSFACTPEVRINAKLLGPNTISIRALGAWYHHVWEGQDIGVGYPKNHNIGATYPISYDPQHPQYLQNAEVFLGVQFFKPKNDGR